MGDRVESSRPLDHIRVVNLSHDSVGVRIGQVLADYGAEVVLVEPPGGIRQRRQPSFPFLGRGQRSLVADLRSEMGRTRIRPLIDRADVLIESFRPGVADRLGLGYELLSASNPRLIHTSVTGFGRFGPWRDLKGYEGTVAALIGLFGSFSNLTRDGGRPPFLSVPWCSFAASHAALQGILSALLEREESGAGQWVETNLAQALTIHEGASSSWYGYLVTHRWPEAFVATPGVSEQGTPGHHFIFRLLVGQTKDGDWLQFAQNRPHLFEAFLHALGLGWMLTDPDWKGIPVLDDAAQRDELWRRMLAAVREKTLADWEAIFAADRNIFAELYRRGPEVLDHPQLVHDRSIVEIDDPERGPVRQPAPQFRLGGQPIAVRGPAPLLDSSAGFHWATPEKPARSPAGGDRPPLSGITVMELAVQYAAPYGATLLADLGARVIKVEQLEGDSIRGQQPAFPEVGGGKVMQGKESIAVDIRTSEGLAIVHELAGRVDAVVNGFRANATRRGGYDADTLLAINPGLIYVSALGYGEDGPCGDRAAFAPSFSAAGGIAAAQLGGAISRDPLGNVGEVAERSRLLRFASTSRYASADGNAALGVATAVLIGLVGKRRDGIGQHVISSMLLSTAHAMAGHVISYPGAIAAPDPGLTLRGPNALYHVYDAADGWVFLAAPQEREWALLVAALAEDVDLAGDSRFATTANRRAHDAALTETLAQIFSKRPKAEWQRICTERDVACVAVTTDPPERILLEEAYGGAGGYTTEVDHPVFGHHARLAPIVRFSRSTIEARAGCLCGEHTDTVLEELGYDQSRIADLRARKVIG